MIAISRHHFGGIGLPDMVWAIQSTISGLLQGQPDFPLIIDLIHALSLNISALGDLLSPS